MKVVTSTDIRVFLTDYLRRKLETKGGGLSEDLTDDCDLLLSGLIDSLGLLEIISALGEYYSQEIDFEGLDPEQMTIVGPLCSFVAEQLSQE